MVKPAYALWLAIIAMNLVLSGCSQPAAAPEGVTPTSVHGQLVLPPGPDIAGMQVIGTIRLDGGETIDEWLILNKDGGFAHDFQGELIGLRVATGIEAVIISYGPDDFPMPDRTGQIRLGDIDTRDHVIERTLQLQMDEGLARSAVRIGMWFGEPAEGVSLGSRQFPVVETGSTMHWLLPHDATDIYFLIEHPQNPGATAESWRSGSQQRFGPYNSTTFPDALTIRSK